MVVPSTSYDLKPEKGIYVLWDEAPRRGGSPPRGEEARLKARETRHIGKTKIFLESVSIIRGLRNTVQRSLNKNSGAKFVKMFTFEFVAFELRSFYGEKNRFVIVLKINISQNKSAADAKSGFDGNKIY